VRRRTQRVGGQVEGEERVVRRSILEKKGEREERKDGFDLRLLVV
jgi:hypothetical protein